MNKGLIFVLGILSFLGINTVSAKEIYLEYDTNVNEIKTYIDEIGYDKINNSINKLITYYNENLSNNYPYYIISLSSNDNTADTSDDKLHIVITAFDDSGYEDYFGRYFDQSFSTKYLLVDYTHSNKTIQYEYNYDSDNISLLDVNDGYNYLALFEFDSNNSYYNPFNYYFSNFDLYYRGDIIPTSETSGSSGYLAYLKKDDILYIPSFEDSTKYSPYNANSKFLISPYYLYDDNTILEDNKYITIDLNQYSYVILSLKNYSISEAFSSVLYVKGQVCITPVYNYGSEEKKDYISGWQSPPCTGYLKEYTSNYLTISKEDITNHAVYYLTGYDSSKSNLVMVKNSIFDITYITSENENNPNIIINGKNYTSLPYSTLTDTAELTEKNGMNGTFSCAKYDTDCIMDSSGINIDNLFSSPLETLETIWDVITSTFKLVTEFISLLPQTLQAFLYLAFGVGIALGIIKIIL